MQLHEQYRPRAWSDVIGQDKAVRTIQALVRRGIGGRALWVTGGSGQGKSTIARLVSAEIADGFCTFELAAGSPGPGLITVTPVLWPVLSSPGLKSYRLSPAKAHQKQRIRKPPVTGRFVSWRPASLPCWA